MKRALISVSNKTGVVELATELIKLGFEIVSTGGTAKILRDNDLNVTDISEITGFRECLDGRVKTLHPFVHAGLLALRNNKEHMDTLCDLGIETIDLVAVNLYPFAQTVRKGADFDEVVENIDIGGPAMIRSAAKNYESVVVLTDHKDYETVLERLKNNTVDKKYRLELMYKAFAHTARYDAMISGYLGRDNLLPDSLTLTFDKVAEMRYGENPHQAAALYKETNADSTSLAGAVTLQGKELSFNNLNDAHAAVELLREFGQSPACVAVKHAAPCGVALGDEVLDAYIKAHSCDPVSVYGGIVAVNREVDKEAACEMIKTFLEVIIAPAFTKEALDVFTAKPNLRVIKLDGLDRMIKFIDYKRIFGGMLAQECDGMTEEKHDVVTHRAVSGDEMRQMEFANKIVKHARSNAIVICRDFMAVGIAGGQTSRVWAAKQAAERAGERAKGGVAASDAYFPFSDSVDTLAKAGVCAIIQPGGSIRDQDSIDLCNKLGIGMVFTGKRHFKH